ncbi:MAG: hypothetical protein ACPIOQ_49000, partial [Promethearchaeia archaeon]
DAVNSESRARLATTPRQTSASATPVGLRECSALAIISARADPPLVWHCWEGRVRLSWPAPCRGLPRPRRDSWQVGGRESEGWLKLREDPTNCLQFALSGASIMSPNRGVDAFDTKQRAWVGQVSASIRVRSHHGPPFSSLSLPQRG